MKKVSITTATNGKSECSSCQSTVQDSGFSEYATFLDTDSFDKDDSSTMNHFSLRSLSLGRLSLLILILATLADQAVVHVYHSSSSSTTSSSPRFSLGSAAISTITEKLSPILPFAGGMDLRRDDYWNTGSWLDSVRSITTDVKDAYQRKQQQQPPQPTSTVSTTQTATIKPKAAPRVTALSTSKPFISVDSIAELTLGEIGELFRWTTGKPINRSIVRTSSAIAAMQRAIDSSSGSIYYDTVADGDLDALKFVAAMRIFAEWRIVRQVPEGYKGFAVGMSIGHKDVVQNLVKLEESVHRWLDDHPYSNTRPTLRQLLTWEIETGIHPKINLPRLKENTAGIGLLWVRRQLAYQTKIFDNVVHSERFPSMKDAVSDAYKAVYDKYHGWAVQKLFNYSFQAAPDATKILLHMNPHKLKEVVAIAAGQGTRQVSSSSSANGDNNNNENRNPIQEFFHNLGREWDKLRGAKPVEASSENAATDSDYVTRAMIKDAHIQIAAYLEAAQPVLQNLANLFDELNMDDPSRV
jgi:Glycolipid transfer protein (GLTP)